MNASSSIPRFDPRPTADDCLERARHFFSVAMCEVDPVRREGLMIRGERWMAYWRCWSPELLIIDDA